VGLLVAGGVTAGVILAPNKNAPPQHFSPVPATQEPKPVNAKFTDEERFVAARFIQTAVARKNLEEAWTLVGPNLRGTLTRAQWITGNNPVVPFPIDKLDTAPYKVDYSYTDSAMIEIALLPKKGSGVRSQLFMLILKKLGKGKAAHWVVDYWVPRSVPVVPQQ
jgi:hypothetical protein